MRALRSFPLALAALTGGTAAQALLVPSQYPTIGAALAAAPGGATILVAPGTYQENLVWPAVDGIHLISTDGAATTTIDGAQSGTVVVFGSGLTRRTWLIGFTITNGFLNVSHSNGAGIRIDGASPTIRGNRITANTSDNVNWNYGGGIYVGGGGSDPLIEQNEIDGNQLLNGSWNYGAGVHIASGANAVIRGNHVHDNANLTPSAASGGRGHGAGIYCAGSAVIASNLITGNLDNSSSWNYGGGIRIASSGSAQILHNTIADNVVTGGNWQDGGGVHVDGSADATLRGNIIANNTGEGVFVASGTGGVISSDWDDLWNNSGTAYSGLTAGPNSLALDPQFAGPNDWHLLASSPCLDAAPNAHLVADAAIDFDGDPRQIDRGSASANMVDLGADEVSDARLDVVGSPQLGATITWSVTGPTFALQLFAVAFGTGNTVLPPYGNLLLDQAGAVFVGVTGVPGGFPLAIPNLPTLRGVTLFGQSLALPAAGSGGQFTNLARLTIL
ncbi:MAG: right-handed parallel beta-helix repeat-containing protein [Planctomycetes bacterium]|nr:right-handed parallel beta-helix repeat-containing protein [Planctomycetota bacterium]